MNFILRSIDVASQKNIVVTVNIVSDIMRSIILKGYVGAYLLNLSNTTSLNQISIAGFGSKISPPISFPNFPKLLTLQYSRSNITTYNSFHPSLESFYVSEDLTFNQIPNVQVPSTLKSISFTYNNLIGTIPDVFQNSVGLDLDVSYNQKLTGSIPESLCHASYLNIINTNITSLPQCFWCYINNPRVIQTDLPFPIGFTCSLMISSNIYYTELGRVNITGSFLGWGYDDPSSNFTITPIIPNEIMAIKFRNPSKFPLIQKPYQVSTSASLGFSDITFLEIALNPVTSVVVQYPIYLQIIFGGNFNPYLGHNITLMGTNCLIALLDQFTIHCRVSVDTIPSSFNLFQINLTNVYQSKTVLSSYQQKYPKVKSFSFNQKQVRANTTMTMIGNFGFFFASSQITINQGEATCTTVSINATVLVCTISNNFKGGVANISVQVDSYSTWNETFIETLSTSCEETTHNCWGNGQCSVAGTCVCNDIGFYQDCSKPYPMVTSGEYNQTLQMVNLYGDFGPYGQAGPNVMINNSVPCNVVFTSQTLLNCTVQSPLQPGLASVSLVVDTIPYNRSSVFLVTRSPTNSSTTSTSTSTTSGGGGPTPQEQCEKDTNHCFGNGQCNVYGQCLCNRNYNPDDNCKTLFSNATIHPNATAPTASFEIDGITFDFQVVAIQEIGLDGEILKEMLTNNWNVNITNTSTLTTATYQLNNTDTRSVLYNITSVIATISYSPQERDVTFGPQLLHINPNSIKLAININNWVYSSHLATLLVLLETKTNENQQTVTMYSLMVDL
ncbi:hypothetical protein DFA_09566 [Cavenderia fasciculata]|uniref:ComC supersandwich domain-containing protein n=1 Tax=Cavenderia fasciculata TaxID=261658 RepID=F4Q7Z7_CACFS|nr:uncharacterized protein DFA_09566 [Cavenderia fasciculata]EGG15897.1 hypothetical protein DFA_09566 [Cavenderia fasciculata]|eukprot:XP_004352222.1 hypothetical protein DFA_09566 [Cavenderia fasciculata]